MSSSKPQQPGPVTTILASMQERLRRIDDLERRINDRAIRARRRIATILEHAPTHRQSHLRCFVTHEYETIPPTEMSPLPASEWSLRVEGKLLIGHLDHESAAAYDDKTGYVAPADDGLDRSKGDKEEEEVLPIKFTHFFERVEAEFQPIYSPKPNPMAAAISKKKLSSTSKKRRGGASSKAAAAAAAADDEEFRRSLIVNPFSDKMIWTKSLSPDAHAFDLTYRAPPPRESRYQIHCVIAKLKLYPSTKETLYKVTPKLMQAIFPNHATNETENLAKGSTSKKRPAPDAENLPVIPTDPEIHTPESWTLTDLSMAFYQYIQDNRLFDETAPSTVVCNEALQTLFGMESFGFAQLQSLLVTHDLVRQHAQSGVEPVSITYVCKSFNATNAPPPDFTNEDEDRSPALLQIDIDVWVPSLFPFRCREILRRIKRRELEYTSSRTKGRYILMARKAKEEDDVKAKIEACVEKDLLGRDMIPVQIALAKGALPRTEARMVSHTEARLSLLMERLEEECTETQEKWQEYQAILSILEKASNPKVEPKPEPMDTS